MSETRSFLARWSERKRAEARAERAAEPPRPPEAEALPAEEVPAGGSVSGEPSAPLDLEALPSLEDITGESDIGAFLRRGVPGDLRNAALRRAWTSDPTISRFIEMADYDWDFNAPGGNQVFGPLSSAVDAARMAAEILNPPPRAASEPVDGRIAAEGPAATRSGPDGPIVSPDTNDVPARESDDCLTPEVKAPAELSALPSDPPIAMSTDQESPQILESKFALRPSSDSELAEARAARRRRHGGALPDSK